MDPGKILVRAIVAYLFALVLLRLSGKRTIAEATAFDFVLAVIVGDMFDDLLWAEVTAAQFIVATGTLVMMELATSAGNYLSPGFGWMVEGQPQRFVRDGKLQRKGMRAERLNEKDVEMLLRHRESLEREKWPEVRSAMMELDGQPSVLKHEWARDAQKQDLDSVLEAKE